MPDALGHVRARQQRRLPAAGAAGRGRQPAEIALEQERQAGFEGGALARAVGAAQQQPPIAAEQQLLRAVVVDVEQQQPNGPPTGGTLRRAAGDGQWRGDGGHAKSAIVVSLRAPSGAVTRVRSSRFA